VLCTLSEPEFSPLLKDLSEREGANKAVGFSAGRFCPPEDTGLCLGTSVVVMMGGGEEVANQPAPGREAYQNMPGYMLANDNAPTSHAPSPGEAHWPSKGFRSGFL